MQRGAATAPAALHTRPGDVLYQSLWSLLGHCQSDASVDGEFHAVEHAPMTRLDQGDPGE